jgi:hypothetical protein
MDDWSRLQMRFQPHSALLLWIVLLDGRSLIAFTTTRVTRALPSGSVR